MNRPVPAEQLERQRTSDAKSPPTPAGGIHSGVENPGKERSRDANPGTPPQSSPAKQGASANPEKTTEKDVRSGQPEVFIWNPAFWQAASRASTIGVFLLALCVCLDLARGILTPIVSAVVIGLMLGPLGRRAAKHNIPAWLFASAVLVVAITVLQGLLLVVASPMIDVVNKAPEYTTQVLQKLDALEQSFPMLGALHKTLTRGAGEGVQVGSLAAMIQPILAFLSPAIGQILIFIVTLFFFVLGHNEFRRSLVLASDDHDRRLRSLRIINNIELSLTCYFRTVSVINLALGIITGIGAWAVGLPMPVLWGVLACVANFIPYIGPAVIVAALFGVGLLSFGTLGYAFLPPLLFIGLTTIEGHFITPNVVGRRFTADPFAVFMSLAFWTWLWGPVGAFLSMPFLLIGMAILHHLLERDDAELPV